MYDVIVVGARCAGSPLAMLLARKGYRVLVLDRSVFPSDTISTHYIQPSGLARLHRWGLLDRLAATGCPPISEAEWWFGDMPVRGFAPPSDGVGFAFAPRRTVLDALLVEAARLDGAEIRESFTVRELVIKGGQVIGVRGRSHGGREEEITAPVVVGADGRHSLVARTMEPEEYLARPALTVVYYTYWRGLSPEHRHRNEVFIRDGNQIGIIPTHDDALLIQAAKPHAAFAEYRADIERHYHRAIEDAAPALAREIAAKGEQVTRFFGTGSLENYYRKPYGAGWALVGDAGYHKDPLTGQGISDAWRDAEALAEALDMVFTGRRDWETALGGYENARNAASEMLYDFTCEAATFEFSPTTLDLMGALSRDRAHANRFFGVIAGTVPAEEFFSPDNFLTILGGHAGEDEELSDEPLGFAHGMR